MILIKNGRVIDPAKGTDDVMDMVIDGGKIKAMGHYRKMESTKRSSMPAALRWDRDSSTSTSISAIRALPIRRISGPERQRRKREASPQW